MSATPPEQAQVGRHALAIFANIIFVNWDRFAKFSKNFSAK